jgi:DNA repair protein RadC
MTTLTTLTEEGRLRDRAPLTEEGRLRDRTPLTEEGRLRDRARIDGYERLGDAELIAMILGATAGQPAGSLARAILEASGGLGGLVREGLRGGPWGLGEARRTRLEAAIELGRRGAVRGGQQACQALASPSAIAAWGRAELGALSHEELWLLGLDGRHGLLAARRLAQGGNHGCAVTVRDIFRPALRVGASAFALVHNHPSGDPTPSIEDVRMTEEVARAGSVMGLPLVDHVVIGGERHASFFELGLIRS